MTYISIDIYLFGTDFDIAIYCISHLFANTPISKALVQSISLSKGALKTISLDLFDTMGKDKTVKIAVASNKYQTATDKIVRHFFADIPFVSIQGQIEGRPVKPDPSIVFTILNQSPTPKSEVIYIGDSAVDIETARRACVTSVGVTWGFRTVSELRQAYADHIISSPSEILNLLNEPF
jgi:phosphoglycolate phosphatase-like HAD superfamily hydrolase